MQFSRDVPTNETAYAMPIRRCPTKGDLVGIVTSHQILGTYTHYYHSRTVPCDEPEPCDACQDGYSKRYHVYVGSFIPATNEHVILELTAAASDSFRNYQKRLGTMRGCWFKIHRPSGRPNGRIHAQCKHADQTKIDLPTEPNLIRALCHIWNKPLPNPETTKPNNRIRDQHSDYAADDCAVAELFATAANPTPVPPEPKNGKPNQ